MTTVVASGLVPGEEIPSPAQLQQQKKDKKGLGGLLQRIKDKLRIKEPVEAISPAEYSLARYSLLEPFCNLVVHNVRNNLLNGIQVTQFYVRYSSGIGQYKAYIFDCLKALLSAYLQAGWYIGLHSRSIDTGQPTTPVDVYNIQHGIASRNPKFWLLQMGVMLRDQSLKRKDYSYLIDEDDDFVILAPTGNRFTHVVREDQCPICQEQPSEVMYDCGHCPACRTCDQQLTECPMCRSVIGRRFLWKTIVGNGDIEPPPLSSISSTSSNGNGVQPSS